MKIALCLSGIPRGVYCHELLTMLGNCYETYLFMYYWKDAEQARKHSYGGKPTFPFNPQSFCLPGVEVHYTADTFESYVPTFQAEYNKIEESKRNRKDLGIFGMTYGIYRANLMREEYEKEKNMQFDCVFRIRFESGIRPWPGPDKLWNIHDYNMDILWLPDINVDLQTGMNDQFAFSGPKIMSYYSRVYEHVVTLSNISCHSPETIFHRHLDKKIPIHRQAKLG
jgi:hypothetical protein